MLLILASASIGREMRPSYPCRLSPCHPLADRSREKLDLVNHTKKVIGQLESVLRGLHEDEQCADVHQCLSAAHRSINSLMRELLEAHIRNPLPHNPKSGEESAADVFTIDWTYLTQQT
jgi:DNA-binding FrmR family transcriptional regulator